jgi:hypothetical protein
MRKSFLAQSLFVAVLLISTAAASATGHSNVQAKTSNPQKMATMTKAPEPVVLPFELINKHIFLKVNVGSRPLWFVLDTGDKFAIIDLDRAKELGLNLEGAVRMGGAGANTATGAFVKGASFTVPGVAGFSQPVTLALPIRGMAPRLGQDFDGIIGADFISQFVVEVDYEARVIRLHDKNSFQYSGRGEAIPIHLNSGGHPIIEAEVTPLGGTPVTGNFVIDIGSGGALALYSPFVTEHQLLTPSLKTIKAIGSGGAGGQIAGQLGRVAELKIGSFKLTKPVTLFSQDKAGAFASSALIGNIGQQVMSKFKIWLDYGGNQIIMEPNATFNNGFDRAFSGLSFKADGNDYKTFRITDVLEDSPASEAGLQINDVIVAVNDQQAGQLTLTGLIELFERSTPYKLTVRRGEQTIKVTLTPRKLI